MLALANESFWVAPFPERAALIDEATDMARRIGDPRLVIDACLVGFVALWVVWTATERLERVTEALELARAPGREREFLVAATLRAVVLGELGEPAEMATAAELARTEARRLRIGFAEAVLHGLEVPWLAMRGEFDECERRLEELQALSRAMAHSDVDESIAACLLTLRLWQGRAAEVVPVLRGLDAGLDDFAPTVAVYLWRAGLEDEARDYWTSRSPAIAPDGEVEMHAVAHAAELSLYLGLPALAAVCHQRLRAYAGMVVSLGGSMALGPVEAYLAFASAAAGDPATAGAEAGRGLERARGWGLDAFVAWVGDVRARYCF
jgi:hypothetical protein